MADLTKKLLSFRGYILKYVLCFYKITEDPSSKET